MSIKSKKEILRTLTRGAYSETVAGLQLELLADIRNALHDITDALREIISFEQNEIFIDEYMAAKILGLAVGTLRNHRYNKIGLRYYKIGRSVRYSTADIYKHIKGEPLEDENFD